MFKNIVKSIYKFGDIVEDKLNSVMNYFDTNIYNFINRKYLAKKEAIKVKVKELSDKFGLHIVSEYNLYNNPNEICFLYLQCDTLITGYLDYYIVCPTDFAVARNICTNYKYGVVNIDKIKFYDINDNIDKHIQKLIGRYKVCLNEARKKQIEFDFNENKEPLYKDLCNHYDLKEDTEIYGHKHYSSRIIPYFDLYYSLETNKISINASFVDQDPNTEQCICYVEIPCNTFEEYVEFINNKIKYYQEQMNKKLNELLTKKDKKQNDN